jgi:hypothetical protein
MKNGEKQAAKKVYHPPQVTDYGNVTDLTKASGNGNLKDGTFKHKTR